MGRVAPGVYAVGVLILGLSACAEPIDPPSLTDPDRSAAWAEAMSFVEFLAGDTANQALWHDNVLRGAPADLAARARLVGGNWRLLVVAESWCSDAVYTVPFLSALADSVPGLELRLVRTDGHDALFVGHERNGRAAHPLVLILDGDGRERAAWVERPVELAAWIDARRATMADDDLRLYRRGWYAGNGGRTTLTEVLDLMDDVRNGRVPTVDAASADEAREVTPCLTPAD